MIIDTPTYFAMRMRGYCTRAFASEFANRQNFFFSFEAFSVILIRFILAEYKNYPAEQVLGVADR